MVVVDTGRGAQLTMSSSFRHVESLSFPNLNTRTLSSVVFMALSTSFLLPRLFNIAAILPTWSPSHAHHTAPYPYPIIPYQVSDTVPGICTNF